MTPEFCGKQLARLFVLRGLPADIEEYTPALEDIPDARFEAAVAHALKSRHWFPTPAELRADCDAVAAPARPAREESRIEALVGGGREVVIVNPLNPSQHIRVKVHRIWKFDCLDCEDTGWHSRRCPAEACGRRLEHASHEWVERCACIDWNPTIRRRKEAGAKYAKEPAKVGT